MSKKKKVTTVQKNKIYSFVLEQIELKKDIDSTIDVFSLDKVCKKQNLYKKIKNNLQLAILSTNIDDKPAIYILSKLEFLNDEKDSIKVNTSIVSTVDYLEKIFVELDLVKIDRCDDKISNKHCIFIKCIKYIDDVMLENINILNKGDFVNESTDSIS